MKSPVIANGNIMVPKHKLKRLDSVDSVFSALGSTHDVAAIAKVPYRVALNWKNLYDRLPARTYRVLQDALAEHGYVGDDGLWGMIDAD